MAKRRKRDKDYYARWGRLDPRHSVLTPEEAGSSVEAWRDFARARTYPYLPYDPRNPATWARESDPNLVENPRFESVVDPISNKVVGSDKTQAQILKDEDDALFAGKKASRKKKRAAARADRERKAAAALYRGPGEHGVGYREPLPTPSFYDPGKVPEWRRDVFPLDKPPPSEVERSIAAFLASDSEGPVFTSTDRPWTSVQDDSSSIGHNPFVDGTYNKTIAQVGIPGSVPWWSSSPRDTYGGMSKFYEGYQGPKYWTGDADDRAEAKRFYEENKARYLEEQAIANASRPSLIPGMIDQFYDRRITARVAEAEAARKEATAALTATDEVAPVNTIGVGPIDDRGDIPVGAQSIGSTTPDASLNSPAVKEASAGKGDFLSRMARFNEIAPQFLGISQEVLQNRKLLQRRNDVLRAFQRMGPKDIVWSDNMTTAQMVAQYKREQDTFLGRAMAATNPQDKDDVNLLARKLGVGLEGWTNMLDLLEKGRLDYGYLEQEWNVRGKIETDKAEHYADILLRGILMGTGSDGVEYIRSPVEQEEMLDVVLAKTKNIKVRDLVKKGFKSRRDAVNAQEVVRYDLPWGWVDTENNRATLKQLGLTFTDMDPTKKTNALSANPWGRTNEKWLFVNINDAAAYNLDLRDKKNRILESALYARPDKHTGFGQSDAAVDAPIMNLVGPNGRVYPGMGYAENNATGKSYADYLSRYYGFSSVMKDQLAALNKNYVGWENKKDYISATAIRADADRVASISSEVIAIDDLERARRDKNGKHIGRSIFGGVTGLQLTIMNYQQLADDLISFAGGEPSGPGVAQYDPGTDEAQAGVLFNEFMLTNTAKEINDILDDLDDPTKLIDTDDEELKEAKDKIRIDMHLMRARIKKMLDETPANFQQNALYAEMLSISLATMAARMLTRKDRLLKDQYTMWRDQLNIHKWSKSADRARAQMQALKRFAKFSSAYYVKTIQDLTPPAHKYQRTREGHLEAASTRLTPTQVDDLVREHG